jgi:protein transport protein SEC31
LSFDPSYQHRHAFFSFDEFLLFRVCSAPTEEAQVAVLGKHEGEVKGLDWNKMHILASGGSDGNIYVWDMKKYPNHATVCPISAPLGEITSVAWNRSIPRILGASLGIGQTIIWDLQSKKSICKIKDPNHSFRTSALAWNPSVVCVPNPPTQLFSFSSDPYVWVSFKSVFFFLQATQLVVTSEDDKYSCMQLWDLRKAVSPVEVYSGHDSGILGVSWCEFDPSFILTSGMDNRALCWDYRKNCVVLEVRLLHPLIHSFIDLACGFHFLLVLNWFKGMIH